MPSLEGNEVVCKLLDSFLKDSYFSKPFILDDNSFDIFYCNYVVNGNYPLVKSFNLSFYNNKLSSAIISEWDFSKETGILLHIIANILATIKPNIDYYKEIKQLIDKWSDENIIAQH